MADGQDPRVEHRHMTVLFTDLVASTRLTKYLGDELARAVTRDYIAAVKSCVQTYDGYVARIVGDGVLIYFGWPIAREDAAECAVLAAQDVHAALEKLSIRRKIDLQCKAAIATGSVIIGAEDGQDDDQASDAYGEAPQLAARLQELSGAGETIVARETRGLVARKFEFAKPFAAKLDGFDSETEVFRLVRERRGPGKRRTDSLPTSNLVGREDVLATLKAAWAKVQSGHAQSICLVGDAGMGKSRLMSEFRRSAGITPEAYALYRCSRLHSNTPYNPLIMSLTQWSGLRQGDPTSLKTGRITAAIDPYLTSEQVKLVLEIATQSEPGGDQSELISERRYREALQQAYLELVRAVAKERPMLLHFDNAHWADPSTLSIVNRLIRDLSGMRVLIVLSGRPMNGFPDMLDLATQRITLKPLDEADSRKMISQSDEGAALDERLVRRLYERSNGVPQFIEECLKSLSDRETSDSRDVPSSLKDLFQEQLDQLGELRAITLAASTIGCPFDAPFLAAVAEIDLDQAVAAIASLAERGVLIVEATEGDGVYSFANTLQRDAAYGCLVTKDRNIYHGRVLRYAEAANILTRAWQPELRAHHFQGAGQLENAAIEWAAAAKISLGRFAPKETLDHAAKGLSLLKGVLSETAKQAEVHLNTSRGAAHRAAEGPGAVSSIQSLQAAMRRAVEIDDKTSILHVGRSLSVAHHVRAEYQDAEFYARQIQSALNGDVFGRMIVHTLLAMPMIWQGNFNSALVELGKADELANGMMDGRKKVSFESQIRSLRAVAEAFLGNKDQALNLAHEGVELAKVTGRPQVHASALMLSCNTHQIMLHEGTMVAAQALKALAKDQGLPFYQASAQSFIAASLYNVGEVEKGFDQLNKGWVAFQATTSRANQMLVCRELARGCLLRGAIDEGLKFVEDGLDRAETYQERNYLAEIFRLKGELLERKGVPAEDSAEFYDRAIDRAQRQNAALFELWATEQRLALPLAPSEELKNRLKSLRGED